MDRDGPLGWSIKRKSEIAHFGIPSQAIQGTREQMTCSGKGMMRASTIFFAKGVNGITQGLYDMMKSFGEDLQESCLFRHAT